jgi:hypothetical protein
MGLEANGLSNLYLAASGIQAAGTAANTYAQVNAQRDMGRYQRQTAEEAALMAELQAKDVGKAADKAIAQRGLDTRAMIARQRAAAAGQGVDVASGSVVDITGDTAAYGAVDAEQIANNAFRSAWGLGAEASQTRQAGRNARDASRFNARMTAASGGLQFGREAIQGAYGAEMFRAPKTPKYVAPPGGKKMSDPRNR